MSSTKEFSKAFKKQLSIAEAVDSTSTATSSLGSPAEDGDVMLTAYEETDIVQMLKIWERELPYYASEFEVEFVGEHKTIPRIRRKDV